MNDEKANEKQYRNMRWKGNEPVRPIDENHLSTQKQGLQGALISEPSIPSEMLTSDPPLTPPQRAFAERERVKKIERQRKVLWRTSCFGVSYVTFIDRTRLIIYRMDCIFYELHKFAVTYYSYLGISIFYRDPYSNFCVYTL